MLVPLNIPPGVWRNGTQYQAAGRWYDANLVRWVQGVMQPMGGWAARTASTFSGMARGIITWRKNDGTRMIAVCTPTKAYHVSESNVVTEITPSAGFTTGTDSAAANTGYGGYTYGYGAYGTPRPDWGTLNPPTTWSLDTWGEELVGCSTSDGKILKWDCNTSNDFTAVTNAPTGCRALVVTADRILMALGASGNPRSIKWCDQEGLTTWTATDTNRAGSWLLQTQGQIMCGKRVRGGTIILTNVDAHLATYVNFPLVYGFDQIGSACGVIGPNAAAAFDGYCAWMGQDAFYLFDGTVKRVPSDVQDYVFSSINLAQKEKVYAFVNSVNSEVWWLYPSGAANECDSYVCYAYLDNHWTVGRITRTCGVDRGAFRYPLMVGTDGYLYDHEFGANYGTATPFAESGPFELGSGEQIMHALKLVPDERTSGDCSVTFKARYYPNGAEYTAGAYSLASPTSVRFSGRQASIVVSGARLTSWRWGVPRLDVVAGGKR